MSEHYVTLIDSLFLPQVVTLHASMCRHCYPFTLWVLCIDDDAHWVLDRLALDGVRLLRLADLESPELHEAKRDRTRAEYCWTLTPCAPRFVFDADQSVSRVTYIDADLWFLRAPSPLFAELESAERSVLITEHGYPPGKDQSATSGRFCVQFMSFTRGAGERVRSWWEERCIEWCYARLENGRFGDQKYLDDWPERFSGEVHVLSQFGFAMAPWNIARFFPGDPVFYHFHGLRLLRGGWVSLVSRYPLSAQVRSTLYEPYLREFAAALARLRTVGWSAPPQDRRLVWQCVGRSFVEGLRYGWKPRLQGNVVRLTRTV